MTLDVYRERKTTTQQQHSLEFLRFCFIVSFFFSAELELIVCDKNVKVKNLLSRFKETPNLKTLVVMEPIEEENLKLAQQVNVQLILYSDLEVRNTLKQSFERIILR